MPEYIQSTPRRGEAKEEDTKIVNHPLCVEAKMNASKSKLTCLEIAKTPFTKLRRRDRRTLLVVQCLN